MENLKKVIEKFRRLKFRMEKRHKNQAANELAFPEHFALGETKNIEEDAEYEELLDYLRKKMEERRLKAMDQVDDNKINELIEDEPISEIAEGEGEEKWVNCDTDIKSKLFGEHVLDHEHRKILVYRIN